MFDTKYIVIDYNRYCSYCGLELKGEVEYDEYVASKPYYRCNCEDATKELTLLLQIEYLKEQMPKVNTKITNEIFLKHELNLMKNKYERMGISVNTMQNALESIFTLIK